MIEGFPFRPFDLDDFFAVDFPDDFAIFLSCFSVGGY